MSLVPGTRIGPYEIQSSLGAGGMGEAYRARDRKLDRDVAIKILPGVLSSDPERLARFQREAKVLAAVPRIIPACVIIAGLVSVGDCETQRAAWRSRWLRRLEGHSAQSGRRGWIPRRVPIADGDSPERFPRVSPNGRWAAFPLGAEVGRPEVVFLPLRARTGRWQVSTDRGARTGAWSQDDKEFYYGSGQDFISVAVEEQGDQLQIGNPRVLFQAPVSADRFQFDVGPDGRFLIPVASGNSSGTPLTIVVNWPATLPN